MHHFTALATLLGASILLLILVFRRGARFGVKPPATSGNADFERVFRAQMNTLDWLPSSCPRCGCLPSISGWMPAAVGRNGPGLLVHLLRARLRQGRGRSAALVFMCRRWAAIVLWAGSIGVIVWRLVQA